MNSLIPSKNLSYYSQEVEEILELLKSTWRVLGITETIHYTCYAWVLFRQVKFLWEFVFPYYTNSPLSGKSFYILDVNCMVENLGGIVSYYDCEAENLLYKVYWKTS